MDALFLASKSPAPNWRYHLNGGIRLDRTAKALEEDRLTVMSSDLLTLGTSDSNALLFAAGVDWRVWESVDVFGEWSYDLLIGEEAPEIKESPMRFALGARFPVVDYQMSVGVETNISRVVPIDPRLSLSPVEPIVALRIGLSLRPPVPVIPLVVKTGRMDGVVLSPADTPIAGAIVSIGEIQATTQSDGVFQFGDLPTGLVDVKIQAPGHVSTSFRAEIMAGRVVHFPVVAVPKDTPGQIRFFVRGLGGDGLSASLIVNSAAEGAEETKMESAEDGSAELDLPPGEYTITAIAKGYVLQERKVTVDAYGVTIINLDLMPERSQKK